MIFSTDLLNFNLTFLYLVIDTNQFLSSALCPTKRGKKSKQNTNSYDPDTQIIKRILDFLLTCFDGVSLFCNFVFSSAVLEILFFPVTHGYFLDWN